MEINLWKDRVRVSVSFCISIAALVLCVLYMFGRGSVDHLNLDRKTIGFLVVALLPWLMDRIESFKGSKSSKSWTHKALSLSNSRNCSI